MKPERFVTLILITFVFLINGCREVNRQTEFNWDGWTEKEDGFYTKRELMINDVIEHKLKAAMTYDEIINLLGNPDYDSFDRDREIHYEILEKYGWNIDPEEIKYLDLKFNPDSTLIASTIRTTK